MDDVEDLLALYVAQETGKDVTLSRFAQWCKSEGIKQGISQGVKLARRRQELNALKMEEATLHVERKESSLGKADAAAYLGISPHTLTKWADRGLIHCEQREWSRNGGGDVSDNGNGTGKGRTGQYFKIIDLDRFMEQRGASVAG